MLFRQKGNRKERASGPLSDSQKSFAEFFVKAKNKVSFILCRGVYLAQNTSQAASV